MKREKYDEPDGEEIKRLVDLRKWIPKRDGLNMICDTAKLRQEVNCHIESCSAQMDLYAIGEYSAEEIDKLSNGDIDDEFHDLLENIADV